MVTHTPPSHSWPVEGDGRTSFLSLPVLQLSFMGLLLCCLSSVFTSGASVTLSLSVSTSIFLSFSLSLLLYHDVGAVEV